MIDAANIEGFLPEAEPLPADLIERGALWQRGLRIVDRFAEGGQLTGGLWASGAFQTVPFAFGGQEWMHIISGSVRIETEYTERRVGPGEQIVVRRGLHCRWIQSEPVLKLFLRWDGDGPVPTMERLWMAAMPDWPCPDGADSNGRSRASSLASGRTS